MNNKERIEKLEEKDYQKIFGIHKETFEKILSILNCAYEEKHKQGGKPPKLSVLDKLVIGIGYYREYRTMEHIAFDYNVAKSTISESITWVENTLIKEGTFSLKSKRKLTEENTPIVIVIGDVTEQETERPKKNRKEHILGNKNATQ